MLHALMQRLERGMDGAATFMTEHDEKRCPEVRRRILMLPITSGETTLPATRMTKSSPKPASKMTSGATRESGVIAC